MTKKYISYIWTSVAIVIVWAYLFFNVQKTNSPGENESTKINTWVTQTGSENLANTDTKTDSESMNLWQKFNAGEKVNLKCEIETEQEWWKIKQIVYISSPNIRMDMNVANKAWDNESHMIMDSQYSYIWGANGPAMKMKNVKDDANKDVENIPENNTEKNPEQDMKNNLENIPYNKCSEWIVDDSMFKLPAWTEFMDMETLQEDMMNQATKWMTEEQINMLKSSMPTNN